jgi:hypothetical protein
MKITQYSLYIYTYTYMYIYIHIYIHIHTYIYVFYHLISNILDRVSNFFRYISKLCYLDILITGIRYFLFIPTIFSYQAASFVIILDYNLENEDEFFLNLNSLYKEYLSSRRKLLNNLKHCEEPMSSRVGDPSPLLVLLSIDTFTPSANDANGSEGVIDGSDMITLEEKPSDEEQEEQEQIIIMTAVARTHEFLKEIICKDSASNASMGWYVQVTRKLIR